MAIAKTTPSAKETSYAAAMDVKLLELQRLLVCFGPTHPRTTETLRQIPGLAVGQGAQQKLMDTQFLLDQMADAASMPESKVKKVIVELREWNGSS